MGRLDGFNRTENFTPTVSLVSITQYPLGTIFAVWYGSRNRGDNRAWIWNMILNGESFTIESLNKSLNEVRARVVAAYPELAEGDDLVDQAKSVVYKTVKMVIDSNLPPVGCVQFTFDIEDVPVAFRDQLVRGHEKYWTTTSRTADLSKFDANVSPSILEYGGYEGLEIYEKCVETIRKTYAKLQEMGVPGEDIRLSPGCMIQRDFWTPDLRQLINVLKKRVDWIAQSTLWMPVISALMEVLRREEPILADMLSDIIGKPNVRVEDNHVVEHHYDVENEDRYSGKDPQPCDPLWMAYKGIQWTIADRKDPIKCQRFQQLKSLYLPIWSQEYLDVLGWDRMDLYKSGPYDLIYDPDSVED